MSNMMYIRRWLKIELAICDLEGAFGGLHIHVQVIRKNPSSVSRIT